MGLYDARFSSEIAAVFEAVYQGWETSEEVVSNVARALLASEKIRSEPYSSKVRKVFLNEREFFFHVSEYGVNVSYIMLGKLVFILDVEEISVPAKVWSVKVARRIRRRLTRRPLLRD